MKRLEGLDQIGFTIDKKHDCACGVVNGYKFIVSFHPQARQYSIMTTIKSIERTGVLSNYLDTMDKGEFINWVSYSNNILVVNIKNHKNLSVSDIDRIIRNIADFAYQNGYVQICRHCGQETSVEACSLNGQNELMCSSCLTQYSMNVPQPKQANLALGIVGALVGSLIGVVVWVVIYKMGFVAGITGFIMAVCCLKGYELLGKSLDKKGIVIALIIAVVMLAAAEMISLGLEILDVYGSYYGISFFDAMQSVPFFLEESEVLAAVIEDLAFGYIFMIAASFTYVRNMYKSVSSDGVIERIG